MQYRSLYMESITVLGLLEIQEKHEVICKGCAQGKNENKTFFSSESKAKGILEIVHSNLCEPCLLAH